MAEAFPDGLLDSNSNSIRTLDPEDFPRSARNNETREIELTEAHHDMERRAPSENAKL